jgi:hypothetical protein
METFDLQALIRACLIGLGVAFISGYVVHVVVGVRQQSESFRRLILAAVGIGLLVSVGTYYAWPSLARVPDLAGLAQAEAENALVKSGLTPEARPQMAIGVEAGRVVPNSQNPEPGLPVRTGSAVSFGVSLSSSAATPPSSSGKTPVLLVSLFDPKTGSTLHCPLGGDGLHRCPVKGTFSGSHTERVALWLKPVRPPSERFGWYLQRSGNGIIGIESDNVWDGFVQVGDAQYPPKDGDVVDVAVSVISEAMFMELMGRSGVVVEPNPPGIHVDISRNVVVVLR